MERTPRKLAEDLAEAYREDLLTGKAPGLTLEDLIETAVEERDQEHLKIIEAINDALKDARPIPTCAYCRAVVQPGEPMQAHIRECKARPEHAEIDTLRAEVERLKEECIALRESPDRMLVNRHAEAEIARLEERLRVVDEERERQSIAAGIAVNAGDQGMAEVHGWLKTAKDEVASLTEQRNKLALANAEWAERFLVYTEALRESLDAMEKNIAYATRKDEQALAKAIPLARAALAIDTQKRRAELLAWCKDADSVLETSALASGTPEVKR